MTQQSYQPPYPPQPVKKPKRFGWLPLIIASVVALVLGVAIGSAGDDPATTATPAVTVTATATKTVPAPLEPSTEPTGTEPTEAGFTPRKKDFAVKVKITDKQCFGSAGCSIEFKIDPAYIGVEPLPDTGVIEVTYKITGDEDPIIGSFTIEDGQASFDEEGSMETPRSSTKVKATVTDVEYDENG